MPDVRHAHWLGALFEALAAFREILDSEEKRFILEVIL